MEITGNRTSKLYLFCLREGEHTFGKSVSFRSCVHAGGGGDGGARSSIPWWVCRHICSAAPPPLSVHKGGELPPGQHLHQLQNA